ncbi:PKD domain-containing protein [Pedobacter sp. P351]|uniref:PKD domain-containing protein n=1 Tax=Pedobacter superstes TaxID=3133441 RepID=UPI0030ABA078
MNNYFKYASRVLILKSFLLINFLGLLLLNSQSSSAQSISNEGTEFFAVFPTHVPSRANGQNGQARLAAYSIFITSKQASSGVVTVGNFSQRFTILSNTVSEIVIDRSQAYIDESESNLVLANRAIHVLVDPGKPKVVVYGHIFAGARSAASLILPIEAMGQQYFSMNYDNTFNQDDGANFISVIATEPNTTVLLKRNGTVINTIQLKNVGDVYQYLSKDDPTGTEIVADPVTSACKRFAVFSGSTNSIIGALNCPGNSSDPLYQQNYPVESWGTTYGFVPFSSESASGEQTRTRGSIFRVLAKDDGTIVKVNGTTVATLNSGEFYPNSYQAVPSTTAGIISSNKPVAVAQYAISQACAGSDGVSDPDMVILNPIEYNIKQITVYSSDKENIDEQYLNILIKTSAASSFRINGSPSPDPFKRISSAPEYSYLQLNLNDFGTRDFTLSAQDGFNAIAYGFGDHESYGYSAGTSLASGQTLYAVRKDTREELLNACTKEDFDFKLVLPAQASKLTWSFDPSEPDLVDVNPVSTMVIRNNKTYYEYFYPRTRVFEIAGTRNIKVLAKYLSSNICYQEEQLIEFIFEVYDPPTASYTFSGTCALDSVLFTDTSNPYRPDKPVITWLWDFGDGTTSTLKNPKHKFLTSGDFTVKLAVDNGTGCFSDVSEQTLSIRPLPLASFILSEVSCTSNAIIFSDASTTSTGSISQWLWDFGDGTTSAEQHPNHTFPKTGSYMVKLQVVNSFGCKSNVFSQKVTVFAPILEAGPDKTILRGGQTTLSIMADGNNLKYKWSPSAGLDRDDVKNPVASPDTETLYTVTITSEEGCVLTDNLRVKIVDEVTIPNTFTPNGDGVNDFWVIKYLESFPSATINIFTRYGVPVFTSRGYFEPWDGSWQGDILSSGTYYYVITTPNKPKPYSGFVTILR